LTFPFHLKHFQVKQLNLRPCVRRFFSEIFVFASFGNCRLSNFGNISVISELFEHFRTRENRKFLRFLQIFRKFFAKKLQKLPFFASFVFASFGKYEKITNENNEKNDVQLVSSRLAKNSFRLETRLEFRKKVRNAGP